MFENERNFDIELEKSKLEQEKIYEDLGITDDKVREIVNTVKKEFDDSDPNTFIIPKFETEYIYLTSSDPIRDLWDNIEDIENKKILTIAGNGAFVDIFTSKNAKQIDVYDISTLACFWGELKNVANKTLTYEEYKKMFYPYNYDIQKETNPFFDSSIYQKIAQHLSHQARTYFDLIQKPRFEKLFDVDEHNNFDHLRRRGKKEEPALNNPESYSKLQKNAIDRIIRFTPADITRQSKFDIASYDYIYISNIGYEPEEQQKVLQQLLSQGAKRIGFTLPSNDLDFILKQEIKVNSEIKLQNGIKIKIISIDEKTSYGIYAEAYLEDNKN